MADIKLPKLGEGISSVEISDILIKTGDNIKLDDPLIVVETEKASMEIPATATGNVDKIHVSKGDTISPGELIISISGDNVITPKSESIIKDVNTVIKHTDSNTSESISSNKIDASFQSKTQSITSPLGKPQHASPSVRRFARELGCELKKVNGSGTKGRIRKEDIQKYIKEQLSGLSHKSSAMPITAPGQDLDFSKFGDIEIQPLNKIKRITGQRLQQAWQAIPHVTQFDICEIGHLEKLRQKWKQDNLDPDTKASLVPFFIKTVGMLLLEMPQFNSSLDSNNENLILKKYINVGVAVDTEEGLVVPIIKDVKNKSILDIAKELTLLSRKARNKKLEPVDMEGGCFTISSLGGIGGTHFTPIVNPPEVAILGVGKKYFKQILINNEFQKRSILPLSLYYDHRIIDGAEAARFTNELKENLGKNFAYKLAI